MWKEIEEKFQVKEGSSYIKMQAFAIETMQRLYRLWKSRLHNYYKNGGCGQNDEERLKNPPPDLPQNQWKHCVERFSSEPVKAMSERNSRNRLSVKRTKHTTGNNSFAEAEHVLTCENNGVKPSADVIWLFEHTTKNKEGQLQWADDSRSKEIYDQLKVVVATHGESMTQEEILLDVLKPRSGYFRGKGTALRGYSKGTRKHLEQQKKIQEQDERIKELEETQEQTKKTATRDS
ncbi:uncharacterized protein LOC110716606 isoform X2 [Chenopodium quinoa]|nr:uncharacterized protein LOC110716606 isoform X2 [Chenopodium quinoa]XP_021750932.1 uncharacterized protein LOC110716606 isoform X2 [Chenopodium quinoa]XP_021750933.1 uncharacterized protein LOC110716606 isoform X2 [Chenopodium quinoa]XP_021750935.1 uncharacterized protein LOC110716606 isoform X2 [Chenopodium quinoa]XP_021750936.1 uncharacterized protein LOC110716606 isoform X2 [Chenopodium quinoa]XP_021750937.1 uncharacterized protein LOC110716606 isoform X2 [Chenopodium quinoa]XP_02175093